VNNYYGSVWAPVGYAFHVLRGIPCRNR